MADPKKSIKDIEKELESLKSKLDKSTSDALSKIIDRLKSGNASLSEWNTQLDLFSTKADLLADNLDYVSRSLVDSVNELIRGNEYINQQVKSTRKLSSISQDLLSMRKGDSTYDLKKIKSLEEQAKRHRRILASQLEQLHIDSDDAKALKEKLGTADDLLDSFREIEKEAKKFQKSMGITGGILKGISQLPIVGNMLGTQEALEAAEEAAKNGAGQLGTMSAAIKSMGKSFISSLTDPAIIVGGLIKGFKTLLDLGFRIDTEITNLSKSMAISKIEAEGIRDRFIEIQNEGKNIFETSTNLVASQLELADATGVTRGFTEQQVRDQILLTKNIGLQAEEAAGIQQLALANGKTTEEITGSVIKQTSILAKQKGIQLDNKKVLGEVAKVSGQLRLQYANNPSLIAKAVVQTQKLGVSLEQAKKAAQGLLDFESSIENELSAELLLGKNINLEKARQLALNGDSAAAMEEIAKQTGTAADFSKLNVIQQEALAKAVGMSTDELADSLVKRENLAKLGDETRAQLEEQIELAKQQGDQDKVNMLERSLGNEAEAQAALIRVSEQEKFNQSIEKLKSIMSDFLSGPAMGIAKWLTGLLQNATLLKGIFIGISTVVGTVLVASFVKSIASLSIMVAKAVAYAAAWAIANPIMASIGLIAAAGVGTLVYSQMKDGAIDPKGGMIVSGEKGSIQLDKEDSIIAGTNLFGKKGNKSGSNSSSTTDLTPLIAEIRALASRPINVSIDGEKVIKATTGANPNTDSDEMNKNSFRTQ